MKYHFSQTSLDRLNTCDLQWLRIMTDVMKIQAMDFTIICGHRGKEEQDKAYNDGNSKLKWPDSKHNSKPSKAIDIAPYPINWQSREGFCYLAGMVKAVAGAHGVKIRWGGDFNQDGIIGNDKFQDLVHFEIVE